MEEEEGEGGREREQTQVETTLLSSSTSPTHMQHYAAICDGGGVGGTE